MSPSSAWFHTFGSPPADPRVYCFPHAGGNARMFLDWQSAVDGMAHIVPVVMPGRGHRFAEPLPTSVEQYAHGAAAAIAATEGTSYYLFGHSLGALVAFEVARRLRTDPRLRHVIASGAAAPVLMPSPRVMRAAALERREFAAAIGSFGGLPPEVLASEELHDLLLPGVQADFRLAAGYRYRPTAPLVVGLSLVNGRDDTHVTHERLAGWDAESRLPVRRHWVPGGHFYLQDRPESVLAVLHALISADDAVEATHSELLI